jgi:hypothetical protein
MDRIGMSHTTQPHSAGVTIDSVGVTTRSLADMVREALAADDSLNRTSLARRARITPKTLRDILDSAPRRYGEGTLRGLDDALGWTRGTAHAAWLAEQTRASQSGAAAIVADQIDRIDAMYAEVLNRLERIEEQPSWVDELVDGARLLNAADRRTVLDLIHRLARD